MRWERHWWQRNDTEVTPVIGGEPTVWVDPNLYEDTPMPKPGVRRRLAQGTVPPPSCIGAYCLLDKNDA